MAEPKITQIYKMFKLLESGEPVRIDAIAAHLGIKYWSVECYVHQMRHLKPVPAEFGYLKEGRKAYALQLLNAKDMDPRTFMYRSNNSVYVKPEPKVEVKPEPLVKLDRSVIAVEEPDDVDDSEYQGTQELDHREVLDTMDVLGIPSMGGGIWE